MKKEVIREENYRSLSDPHRTYTVLMYADGSNSCNCPSWTRRVADDGSRTCKHVIAAGFAPISSKGSAPLTGRKTNKAQSPLRPIRKFNFDGE